MSDASRIAELETALRPFAALATSPNVRTNYGAAIKDTPAGYLACGLDIPVDDLRAAAQAFSAPTEPKIVLAAAAGWKLVPVEPTPEMTNAAMDKLDTPFYSDLEAAYRSMIAASPQPSPEVATAPSVSGVREAQRETIARAINPAAFDDMPEPLTRFKGAGPWLEGDFYVWDKERASICNPDGGSATLHWRKLSSQAEADEAARLKNEEPQTPYRRWQAQALEQADRVIASLASEATPVAGEAKGEPYCWARESGGHFDPQNGGEPPSVEFLNKPGPGAFALYTAPPAPADALKVAVEAARYRHMRSSFVRHSEMGRLVWYLPARSPLTAEGLDEAVDRDIAAIRAKEQT